MTVLERIGADRDAARREARNADVAFYSYLIAKAREPGKADKTRPRESTDDEVITVIRKVIRENEETLGLATGQGEERLQRQNKLLTGYLPEQLSSDELTEIISETIRMLEQGGDTKSKRMIGVIMKTLNSAYPGRFSPALAAHITNQLIEA